MHGPLPICPRRHHAKSASISRWSRTCQERLTLAPGSREPEGAHESHLFLVHRLFDSGPPWSGSRRATPSRRRRTSVRLRPRLRHTRWSCGRCSAVADDGERYRDDEKTDDPTDRVEQRRRRGPAESESPQRVYYDRDGVDLCRACIRPGMVATGTIVELVKIRMMTGNTSGFRPVPRASNWFVYDDRRPCPDLSTERVLQSWILVNYSREGEGADHVRSLSLCLLL
jgi:hypothetical protein